MTETLKVGDLAIYLTTGANKRAHGKVVQITEVLPYQLLYRALDGSTEGGTSRATLRPVKKVTKASEVYKSGDRVTLKKTGKFWDVTYREVLGGTVESVDSYYDTLKVRWDKPVEGGYIYWICNEDVERVSTPATFAPIPEEYILILFKDGKYLPATEPRVYKSEAQAKRVARDMTERHGGEFRVMKLAGVSKAKEVKTFKAELSWG